MQEIELQQRCTAFQELTKDEQYRLIQELLAKRNDPEAQQLLDRYIELFYAMHKSKTETKKEKREWRLSVARVVIGLAGCLVLVVPVAAKCHSLWKEHHQPEVDPGYTLDGTGDFSEEDFDSLEAFKEQYPTMQTPTFIPEEYTFDMVHVSRTPDAINVSISYENQAEEYINVGITHSDSPLNMVIEYDYGSECFFTENGTTYCLATNLDRNVAFWTVAEKDSDKLYIVNLPQKAGDIKEIVFSFQ